MTKVLYIGGAGDEFEFVDAAGDTQTVAQGAIVDVDAATLAKLKADAGHVFWFGDEPEPQHRPEGTESLVLDDGVRREMIEAGARAEGTSVDEAMGQVTEVRTEEPA